MRKFFYSIFIFILFSVSSTSASNEFESFYSFNLWLKNNGFDYRVGCKQKDKSNLTILEKSLCLSKDKPLWENEKNNLSVIKYKSQWSIPSRENPNRDTLIYYLYRYLFSHEVNDKDSLQWGRYEILPSNNPYEFSSDLKNVIKVKEQLKTKQS